MRYKNKVKSLYLAFFSNKNYFNSPVFYISRDKIKLDMLGFNYTPQQIIDQLVERKNK